MTGVELIAAERQRQIEVEGWDAQHDDEHDDATLADAAVCYAQHAADQTVGIASGSPSVMWPFSDKWWKPSPDPIRNLVKAGALIAAEIDRLQRKVQP